MFRSKNLNFFLLGLGLLVGWAVCCFIVNQRQNSKSNTVILSEACADGQWGVEGSPKHGERINNGRDPSTSFHSAQDGVRKRLQHIYTSQIGVREVTGNNDGARVQEYLKYTGLSGNYSYCAAYVCWCLNKAGIDNPKNAWSPALFPAKRVIWKRGSDAGVKFYAPTTTATIPKTGDVFGIYFSNLKRIAHCGFVDSWDGTWCITVEGNTNDVGSVTSGNDPDNPIRAGPGEGVYRKKRLVKTIYRVSNWVDSINHP